MVQVLDEDRKTSHRKSSKGNQLKWCKDDIWYKADYTGYEGSVEYVISRLLAYSTLACEEYVSYDTEEMKYCRQIFLGCKSPNFLKKGWQMITLERLFESYYGESLNKCIYSIQNHEERLKFLIEQTERATGIREFGKYMSKLLTLDAFFLNEDRHTHNIAVLLTPTGTFQLCPVFDNGAGLLSDTTMDYPMTIDVEELIPQVQPATFSQSFEEQLEIAEKLYGSHIRFHFGEPELHQILEEEKYYSDDVKSRIFQIIMWQRHKYAYLFR